MAEEQNNKPANRSPLIGKRFGRLLVVAKSLKVDAKNSFWDCVCKCGRTASVATAKLNSGYTRSCGCLFQESFRECARLRRVPWARERRIWLLMIRRCHRSDDRAYKWYGARGIRVCDRWRSCFENFYTDMGPSNGLWIDRIDNNGNYEPSNCRWATPLENANNTRSNIVITHEGVRLTLAQWARKMGIKYATLRKRVLTQPGVSLSDLKGRL